MSALGGRPAYPNVGDVVKMYEGGVDFMVESVRDDLRFEGFKIVIVACFHHHKRVLHYRRAIGSWRQLLFEGAT